MIEQRHPARTRHSRPLRGKCSWRALQSPVSPQRCRSGRAGAGWSAGPPHTAHTASQHRRHRRRHSAGTGCCRSHPSCPLCHWEASTAGREPCHWSERPGSWVLTEALRRQKGGFKERQLHDNITSSGTINQAALEIHLQHIIYRRGLIKNPREHSSSLHCKWAAIMSYSKYDILNSISIEIKCKSVKDLQWRVGIIWLCVHVSVSGWLAIVFCVISLLQLMCQFPRGSRSVELYIWVGEWSELKFSAALNICVWACECGKLLLRTSATCQFHGYNFEAFSCLWMR